MRYIRALKLGCSPAGDGIESEHLRYGIETLIPIHISNMLSLCIRYSVVPDNFTNGLLIPIPKKTYLVIHNLDLCQAEVQILLQPW